MDGLAELKLLVMEGLLMVHAEERCDGNHNGVLYDVNGDWRTGS